MVRARGHTPLAAPAPDSVGRDWPGRVAGPGDFHRGKAVVPGGARYLLPGGTIGVPTRARYWRTLLGMALWAGLPPLFGRALARMGRRNSLHRLERWWARGMARYLRLHVAVAGLEQIEPGESYIVTPLHEGCADPLALLHLPLALRFVVRDEFFAWHLLGPYLRDTGQIAIRPEAGAAGYRALRRAAPAVFAAGESLVVFPQGSILGIEADFAPGAFALARALRRPILPIALTGGGRVWEHPYTPRLRYGQRIDLRVLPPVPVAECLALSEEALRAAVQGRLKAAALAGDMVPPRRFVPDRDGYWDGFAYRIDPRFAELAADVARHRAAVASATRA